MIGYIALALYAGTIPAANWMIGNVGTVCVPDGPCLIPVGFGLMAPSGVLMIGAALALRDVVHRVLGWRVAVAAIAVGAMLSAAFAQPALVVASVAAFALGEIADFAVYAPLQRRRLVLAVMASGLAGAVIDSVVFLWLAFGSIDFVAGQIVGKLLVTALAAAVLAVSRRSVASA
jgi:uncharacterized PurR-regulated membrane protein YhhQ (DUF165 family)